MKMDESAVRGQRIRTESEPVRENYQKTKAKMAVTGKKMGGGPTDVSHSLPGSGNVATVPEKVAPRR